MANQMRPRTRRSSIVIATSIIPRSIRRILRAIAGGSVWQNLKSVFNSSCLRKAVAIWKSPRKSRSANLLASTYIGLSAVAFVYGNLGTGTLLYQGGTALLTARAAAAVSSASVVDKLSRYLLNPDHPRGGDKARWFEQALGYTRDNMEGLARQIVFNKNTAVSQRFTEHGERFSQWIRITGTNGRVIDVKFIWIRNWDGVVRLVTGLPTDK
ncbi:MAG: hypothetical protein KatS3mg057_1033 [Herpetosiphonaceae bacterium]|nr:MAG: hypothetical protein KatS3mg057_1033 [Herpetosiphonaceae bacterium]